MAILSKVCNPCSFESHNFLKLTFSNIQSLYSKLVGCEFVLESNSSDILDLFVTNLKDSIDSSIFYVSGYLL